MTLSDISDNAAKLGISEAGSRLKKKTKDKDRKKINLNVLSIFYNKKIFI